MRDILVEAPIPNRQWLYFAAPFLYAAVVPFVSMGVIVVLAVAERTVGLHGWFRTGDMEAASVLALCGTILFGSATCFVSDWHRLPRRTCLEHFRQSCLLYCIAVLAFGRLVTEFRASYGGLQYGYLILLFFSTVVGIATNAVVLLIICRRKT